MRDASADAGGNAERQDCRSTAEEEAETVDDVASTNGCNAGLALEAVRASKHWAMYNSFLASPGNKCTSCWLMTKHCCCHALRELPAVQLRPRVVVVMHYLELGKHLGSNTAKLLFHFGAEMIAWGIEAHMQQLRKLLAEDPEGTIVLFPGPGAVTAREFAALGCGARNGEEASARHDRAPRRVVVLDGGWRECKKINESIDSRITRCVVTDARREEYGGTRKYGDGSKTDATRVQTAAAFIALMQELGEDSAQVAVLKQGLAEFMAAWEGQICRSKTWVT